LSVEDSQASHVARGKCEDFPTPLSAASSTAAGVASALLVAAMAGGVLSRSLLHSGASSTRPKPRAGVVQRATAAHELKPLTIDEKLFAHDGPQGKWDVR